MNDTFLKACLGKPVSHTPVWMMRQAGRYLPDYQKVRGTVTFLELCKNPELACTVTMQPVDLLGVDAAILFSDILIPLEAMGLELLFLENHGPSFPNPVRDQQAVDRLIIPDPDEKLSFVLETIRLLRRELADKVPLIGFAGAPFTLATYLIEGGSSKSFYETKKMMYTAPDLYRALLDKITDCTAVYLAAQAKAGAQALQIFDSWAGVLAPADYEQFALPYVCRIISQLKKETSVPIIYFANNGATLLKMAMTTGADVLGIDWRLELSDAIRQVGGKASLQGNLDPCALLLPEAKLRERVRSLVREGLAARGHICNLGHGILPQIPPAQAKIFIDAVHEFSAELRQ